MTIMISQTYTIQQSQRFNSAKDAVTFFVRKVLGVAIRPHKVDLQIIVTIFPIFQVGGRSLFIIHWPISFIKASHTPQKEGVASSLRSNVDNRDRDKSRLVLLVSTC